MKFDESKYVNREEFEELSKKLDQVLSYTESLAKAMNILYNSIESITPPEKLRILRGEKMKEIFDAE